MDDIIQRAKDLADRHKIRHVMIASLGDGAQHTAETFGVENYTIHAVGNEWETKDERVSRSVDALRDKGVHVHLLGHSLFQALREGGEYRVGETTYRFEGDDFWGLTMDEVAGRAKDDPYSGVFQVLYQTLQSLFSDGPRVCVEVAIMAADAGVIPTDEDIVCINRPLRGSNCPHSAMVIRAARSADLLKHNSFRVKELINVAGWRDKWFSNGEIWSE